MDKGILIEPIIDKKEHGNAIQAKTFFFALKITNLYETPSNEFNIDRVIMRSAEGQDILEDFKKSFFIEKLNPNESKIIEIGKYGSYMHGIICVEVFARSTINTVTFDLLQKNPFTRDIVIIGQNHWIDFLYIKNSNEYKQEKATTWMIRLTIAIAFFTLLQIVFILLLSTFNK